MNFGPFNVTALSTLFRLVENALDSVPFDSAHNFNVKPSPDTSWDGNRTFSMHNKPHWQSGFIRVSCLNYKSKFNAFKSAWLPPRPPNRYFSASALVSTGAQGDGVLLYYLRTWLYWWLALCTSVRVGRVWVLPRGRPMHLCQTYLWVNSLARRSS